MNVEAAACPLQHGHPAHATAGPSTLPGHHGVVDEPHRRAQDRRPKGKQAADLVRQADHDLAVRHVRQNAVEEMCRSVARVPRRAGGAQEARLAAEGEDRFVAARRARESGKPRRRQSTRQVFPERALDEAGERPAALLPAGAKELFEVLADNPVEIGVLWQAELQSAPTLVQSVPTEA
jgi:hypothetical protein